MLCSRGLRQEASASCTVVLHSTSKLASVPVAKVHNRLWLRGGYAQLLGGVGGQDADISSLPQGLPHGVMEDVLRVLTLLNLELVHLHGAASPEPGQSHDGMHLVGRSASGKAQRGTPGRCGLGLSGHWVSPK